MLFRSYHAVEVLEQGIGDRVIVVRGDVIGDMDITEALNMTKKADPIMIAINETINI